MITKCQDVAWPQFHFFFGYTLFHNQFCFTCDRHPCMLQSHSEVGSGDLPRIKSINTVKSFTIHHHIVPGEIFRDFNWKSPVIFVIKWWTVFVLILQHCKITDRLRRCWGVYVWEKGYVQLLRPILKPYVTWKLWHISFAAAMLFLFFCFFYFLFFIF